MTTVPDMRRQQDADVPDDIPRMSSPPEEDQPGPGGGRGHAPHPGGDGAWQAAGQQAGADGSSVQGQPYRDDDHGSQHADHHNHRHAAPERPLP